jgi:hypothetical protein
MEFAVLSASPWWTFVFCSLPSSGMVECAAVATKQGLKVDIFVWNKVDLRGKSHAGGARQAASCEYIVAVYKNAAADGRSLAKHYALLTQATSLVRKVGAYP